MSDPNKSNKQVSKQGGLSSPSPKPSQTAKSESPLSRVHIPVHTVVFTALFLVAGLCHSLARIINPFFDTVLFCIQYGIFFGLILYWILSLRVRLLPSRARTYMVIAGLLMLFFVFLQVVKYRVFTDEQYLLTRYSWYAYYVPVYMIPAMFTFSCIDSFGQPGEEGLLAKKVVMLLLYTVAVAMVVSVMTNDLHHLIFIPKEGVTDFMGQTGTYSHGLLFYMIYVFMFAGMVGGLALLLYQSRRTGGWKDALYFFLFPALWLVLNSLHVLYDLADPDFVLQYPYQFPHIHVFCLIGMFESCIRARLMPSNEDDYSDFFAGMKVPAIITDRNLNVLYHTGEEMPETADAKILRDSLSEPVRIEEGFTIQGRKLSNALVFWASDERTVDRLNEQLAAANEVLAGENELIEAQNRLKEKRARVETRNRIYAGISNRMLPAMKRLSALLDECETDRNQENEELFHTHMAQSLVITAYIKRASNLMLADPGEEVISGRELYLAFEESSRYLAFCGITVQVSNFPAQTMTREAAFSLYTAFEEWMEAWLEVRPEKLRMSVACSGSEIRIMLPERENAPDPGSVVTTPSVAVRSECSEGLMFVTMEVKKA